MAGYKIGSYKNKMLKLSSLELDIENFRIGRQDSQPDAIHAMLTRSSAKMLGIADSIGLNGFHDLERVCVFPSKELGHYVVAEGNRRVTALKAMHTPSLAEDTPLFQRFKTLNKETAGALPSQIECAVFQSKKDCLAYVLMRHGYTSDGSGLLAWDSISRRRAEAFVNGKILQELEVIEFLIGDCQEFRV
jgi:hypothetical protein